MRILYVEDNPELRETIGMLMEGEGRTITTCATAEAALELEMAASFDLLVTDVSLPGLSGTDLARQVLTVDPQRWVVLCTGDDLGAHPSVWGPHVRTLMKPFELEDLEALLVQVQSTLKKRPPGIDFLRCLRCNRRRCAAARQNRMEARGSVFGLHTDTAAVRGTICCTMNSPAGVPVPGHAVLYHKHRTALEGLAPPAASVGAPPRVPIPTGAGTA